MAYRELVETGKKHFESGNHARAEQTFRKIIKMNVHYADVYNLLGIIHHAGGRFNNALESFQKAIEINPNYQEALLNLAVLYNDLGQYKKAKDLHKKTGGRPGGLPSIWNGKQANAHARLGDSYREAGRWKEAIEEYKKALGLCPGYADIRTKLGLTYRENGQKDVAAKELTAALKDRPSYATAKLQLGVTYYAMGQKTKAAKAWKEISVKDTLRPLAEICLKLCGNGKNGS